MIEMTRIKLINWHNFQDDCIPVRMITYLIGVNAVGKTTILDAVRYCLTTSKNFNAAGNRKSLRTLQGSVHGKQRGENEYLRQGHTVSYVSVEFLDHELDTHFVITVRVESESPAQELKNASQEWFITPPGTRLESLVYLDDNRRPVAKDVFKASCKGIRQAANQKDARNRICHILGLGDAAVGVGKKFNEVFQMGTSLEEINDITEFIRCYILPEPEIRVEALQSDMRELERLEETLYEAQQREVLLGQIVESCNQALEYETQVYVNDGFIRFARLNKVSELEESYQSIALSANIRLEQLEPQLSELEEKQQRMQDALLKAMQERESHPEVQASSFYKDQEKELSLEYRKQVKRQQDWMYAIDALDRLMNQFHKASHEPPVKYKGKEIVDLPLADQMELFAGLDQIMERSRSDIEDSKYLNRKSIDEIEKTISNLSQELRILKTGKMAYPAAAERVRDAINAELAKRGMDADAKIVCELLYMEDESWQDCTEAVLGARRFDIIVPPKHYYPAKSVFTSMGQKVENISLVDTPNLERDSRSWELPAADTLANKIGSENPYARQYISFLLHGIVCCEDSDSLEKHHRSVTRDLLRHQAYRLERMRRRDRYVGADARKQRCENVEAALKEASAQGDALEKRKQSLETLFDAALRFTHGDSLPALRNNCDAAEKVSSLNGKLNSVQQKLREYEANPLLAALFDRVKHCQEVCNSIGREITQIKAQQIDQERIAREAQENIIKCINEVEAAGREYSSFSKEYPDLAKAVEAKYSDAARTRCAADIEKNQTNYHNQCINNRDRFINSDLIPLQNSYNSKYICDYPIGLDGTDSYRSAHELLTHIELERSVENLRQAKIRCKERFRKEILFRMKDDIANARRQFKELDRVMSALAYGAERYHFTIAAHRDPQLREFYRIILDENNQQITEEDSLFTMQATSDQVYESQVEELMEMIMADIEAAARDPASEKKPPSSQISKYVDYRTFLEYDIDVENIETGSRVPLSSVRGDNSGGENQAPFYVAICASLLQIYQHSPNSIRLVLLDEAFNNMTSDRIAPMMKLFSSAKLQLLLITTVEKCSAIFPYCDLTYSIIKSGSTASLMTVEAI